MTTTTTSRSEQRLDPAYREARKEAFEAGVHTATVELLETEALQAISLEVVLLRTANRVLSAELEKRDRTIRALRTIIRSGT
jgi:hypothetical protein